MRTPSSCIHVRRRHTHESLTQLQLQLSLPPIKEHHRLQHISLVPHLLCAPCPSIQSPTHNSNNNPHRTKHTQGKTDRQFMHP